MSKQSILKEVGYTVEDLSNLLAIAEVYRKDINTYLLVTQGEILQDQFTFVATIVHSRYKRLQDRNSILNMINRKYLDFENLVK